MAVLSFDELNKLHNGKYNRKSMPYEQYFGEMDLSKKQKEERISFSKKFEEVMMFLFFLLLTVEEYGNKSNQEFIVNEIKQKYKDLVEDYMVVDGYVEQYIDDFVREVIDVTNRHTDEPYFKSEDRAVLIAENEANSVLNYSDYVKAMNNGYTKKKWKTELDNKVRKTHIPLENRMVDIKTPFVVGESLMMFPKDTTYGADAEEIVNCRCTVEYIK